MIKLAVRISNYGAAVNIGGDIEVSTYVVEIKNEKLERLLQRTEQYETISLSMVKEDK